MVEGRCRDREQEKKSKFSVNSKCGLLSLGCDKCILRREYVLILPFFCLVQSEMPFRARFRIVPGMVERVSLLGCGWALLPSWWWRRARPTYATGLGSMAHRWLLHGARWLTWQWERVCISGALCPARRRGAWWPSHQSCLCCLADNLGIVGQPLSTPAGLDPCG